MVTVKDYRQVVDEIFSRKAGMRHDLDLMTKLMHAYGNPHENYPIIHVAGTNGKGQVAGKIAFALQNAGYTVGLFLSPHIFDYRDRITVNGKKISQELVIEDYENLCNVLSHLQIDPNFFECTTCIAFQHFAREKIDVAVIEVGLGGKCDATNVILPTLSVITSISLDHTEFLGSSIDEIAAEKAGIIKTGVPVIVGPRAKFLPVFQRAKEAQASLHLVEKKSCFYDTENQAVAKEALSVLSEEFSIGHESIEAGLRFSLPCRFDKRGNVIYDVAHNPDGFARLSSALSHLYPYRTFRFVIGMSRTKDLRACLREIVGKAHHIHFVKADHYLSVETQKLAQALESFCKCPFIEEKSVEKGMKHAKSACEKGEIIVVCGSFYIMAPAMQ